MKMIEDGKRFKASDQKHREKVEAKNRAEGLLLTARRAIRNRAGMEYLTEGLLVSCAKLEEQLEELNVNPASTAVDVEQLAAEMKKFAERVTKLFDDDFD